MEHTTTYTGEDFTPLTPDANQIHIEDIAHALSLMCRANGHFIRFYSVAQHSINCANEAKARGLSVRVQIACLLHDASEAYLSDITRPVKAHLPNYKEIEKRLQDTIYGKFLGSPLTDDEAASVDKTDHDMLVCEFNAMMKKKVFDDCPDISSKPSFEFRNFADVESEFIRVFMGTKNNTPSNPIPLKVQIADIERGLLSKDKADVFEYVAKHKVPELLAEKLRIKQLSAQIDVAIHAYGILLAAIIAFLESKDFVDAIRNAISLGSDSDTLAAITGSIAEAAYGIPTADYMEGSLGQYAPNGIMERTFHILDDRLSSVINAWLDNGKPMSGVVGKNDWKTNEFSKTHPIKTNFRVTESQYAKIRFGLRPLQMGDKWFAYFDDRRIHFHRSWTGAKIYEAAIQKGEDYYTITEIIVERDMELYSNTDDNEDVRSFSFLIGRGLLGLNVDTPIDTGKDDDVLRGWSSFGRMIL